MANTGKVDLNKIIDIGQVVITSLAKEADKKSNNMSQADVNKVAPQVTQKVEEAIKKDIQPIVDNLTNSEANWWQKRSFWSSIVSLVGVVAIPIAARYGLEGYLSQENLDVAVDTLTKLSGVLSAYLAYRAGTALKPLGQ